MKLTVKLFASFQRYLPSGAKHQTMTVDVPDGSKVGQVMDQCGVPRDDCRLAMINGITHTNPPVWMEIELKEGDTLAMLPKDAFSRR